jgi:Transglycosylase SLT domain
VATIDPNLYEDAGKTWNVDPGILRAVAQVESGEDPSQTGAPTRYGTAKGPMQLIDGTAKQYGVTDPYDSVQSVFGGAHYLSDLLDQHNGNLTAALQTYNGAPGDPTSSYARQVLNRYDPSWRSAAPSKASPAPPPAKAVPTTGPTAGMSTDDIINGLTAPSPAAAPTRSAVSPPPAAVPTTGPTAGMSTDDIINGLAAPPRPATAPLAAPPPAPTPPPPDPTRPIPPPIYTAPTTPLIRSPAAPGEPNLMSGTMPAPTGQDQPWQMPAQQNLLTGLGQGLKQTMDPAKELLAGPANFLTGNRFPDTFPGYTATRAADLKADADYQARLGNDPAAAAGFRAAQTLVPMMAGGATGSALKLLGGPGRFLAGTAFEDAPGMLGWAGRRLSGAVGGSLMGAETTAMTGDPNTPLGQRAIPGATIGATLGGAVLPAVSSVANWALNRFFGSGATPAAQRIIRAMTRDDMTPQQLDSALSELGPNASLADVGGANLHSLAETAANSPGPAAQQARLFLNARDEGQTQRMNAAVKLATGAQGSAFDTMEELQDARRAASAPAYDKAFNNTAVTPDQAQQFRVFMDNPTGQEALRRGINIARMENLAEGKSFDPADYGVTLADDGTATMLAPTNTSLRMLDAVKNGYDGVLEKYRDRDTGRLVLDKEGYAINAALTSYTKQLRNAFPQYADALDAWGGPSRDMDALSMGKRVLSADPDVTANAVSNLSDSQKQMYQVGMAQAMKTRIDLTPDDADATRRLFGNQEIRNRIAAGFGGPDTDAYQNFRNTMNQEATFAQSYREYLGGSPSARRLAGMADQAQSPDLTTPILHAVTGNAPAAAANVAHQFGLGVGRWATSPTDAQQRALGELLFSQGPAAQNRLSQAISPGSAAEARSQFHNALTGYPGIYAGITGINMLSPSQPGSGR